VPNVYAVHDVRQMDIHTAVPLVPELSILSLSLGVFLGSEVGGQHGISPSVSGCVC
jgi:hypothetical protein